MEEQLDILNEQGEKTGEIRTYKEAHRNGLWHRTVHAWFLNSKGQLLLQKRSMSKESHPGLWDISVAGHISAGQTSVEATQREVEEEIGLTLLDSAYIYLFTVKSQSIQNNGAYINNEFQDVFLVRSEILISELKIPSDEVEEARWIDIEEFSKWINGEREAMVTHEEEYQKLLDYLRDLRG